MNIHILPADSDDFPPVSLAFTEPDGLLCAGGNLNVDTLLKAYCLGIFPWYSEGEPILWWAPHPRMVLWPETIHVSHSTARWMKRKAPHYLLTCNRDFCRVMKLCATVGNRKTKGTWITSAMFDAYHEMFKRGHGLSVEVWNDSNRLVGGLYGIHLGQMLFAESMFSLESNVSKFILIMLARSNSFKLIDCQIYSKHLDSMGAVLIPRSDFQNYIQRFIELPKRPDVFAG